MLTAFVDGIFGTRTGGEPNVLALHGWQGDSSQLGSAVDGFDAISLDLPGFGASPLPSTVWGAAEYAQSVAPVLSQMRRPRIVVGYSFGGRVAVNLASQFPGEIDALVLVGVPLIRKSSSKKPALMFRVMKRAHAFGLISNQRMEAERNKRGSRDYRNTHGLLRNIFVKVVNESYENQLRNIEIPVHLVWGEADTEAPLWIAEEAAQLLPNATLQVVAGADHWFPMSNPEPIRSAISKAMA